MTTRPPQDPNWIRIQDFSPGIRQHVRVPTVAASAQELGSADPLATWRCMALPRGGIGPLPKRTTLYTRSPIVATSGLVVPSFAIVGFMVAGVNWDSGPEIHLVYEYEETSNSKKRVHWDYVQDTYGTPAATNLLAWDLGNNSADGYRSAAWLADYLAAGNVPSAGDLGAPHASMAWLNRGTAGSLTGRWYATNAAGASSIALVATVDDATENIKVSPMIQHQGRVLGVERFHYEKYNGLPGEFPLSSSLRYTYPNGLYCDPDDQRFQFAQGQGNTYSVGAIGSANVAELLVIMHKGGGVLVAGSLADPTVMALPGVQSTHGAITAGCFTPLGFVYAVKDGGIYVWGGGNISEKLSVDLEDDVWDITPTTPEWWNFNGKFASWDDWILCPNNWVFDVATKSWWRMDDPSEAQIFQWDTSPADSSAMGTPVSYADSDDPVIYRWQKRTLASSYRWRSNILMPTIDRWVDVREITIRAVGRVDSTVTVTLSNEAGTTQAETFTIDSATNPKLYRKNTKMNGSGIKVQIDADSGNTDAAPVVFEVNLGLHQSARAAS